MKGAKQFFVAELRQPASLVGELCQQVAGALQRLFGEVLRAEPGFARSQVDATPVLAEAHLLAGIHGLAIPADPPWGAPLRIGMNLGALGHGDEDEADFPDPLLPGVHRQGGTAELPDSTADGIDLDRAAKEGSGSGLVVGDADDDHSARGVGEAQRRIGEGLERVALAAPLLLELEGRRLQVTGSCSPLYGRQRCAGFVDSGHANLSFDGIYTYTSL